MAQATKIVLVGALGRMGRELAKIIAGDPGLTLSACVEAPGHPQAGEDYGSLTGEHLPPVRVETDLAKVALDETVIVNFSSPAAVGGFFQSINGKGGALVLGTTGLGSEVVAMIERRSTQQPVVFSPNMSLGVNLLFHLTEILASKLAGAFDIEIIEAHHRHKQDAPSGTARRLGEIASSCLGRSYDDAVKNGRAGIVGERPRGEVGMHAVRGGDIVGDHTVLFAGDGERLELRHVAHSRATLARGAVAAAKWVVRQPPGLYSMRDVLGLA
jgi:4-hydroxy-tetrahydrodipicolinate reductase